MTNDQAMVEPLSAAFRAAFGYAATGSGRCGRVNLIGEHKDGNGGVVLVVYIALAHEVAFARLLAWPGFDSHFESDDRPLTGLVVAARDDGSC